MLGRDNCLGSQAAHAQGGVAMVTGGVVVVVMRQWSRTAGSCLGPVGCPCAVPAGYPSAIPAGCRNRTLRMDF